MVKKAGDGGGRVRTSFRAIGLVGLFAALAFAASGCGGGGNKAGGGTTAAGGGNVTALPASSCSSIYQGDASPDFIVASDLPLQGAGRAQTTEMVAAIKFALKQRNFKAGDHNIGYQSCDDSTAQAGAWDSAKCASNARAYAGNKSVIGVVGTFNSGCAKIIVPVLNRANPGPMAMVSPANTSPGLTTNGPGAEAGEPDKYYPTGKRNYARVVANDQIQGPADAQYAKELGLKKIFVLNDKQTYGFGVATTFRGAAEKLGLQVAGFKGWDAKQSSYEALANSIKQSGADGVFLGGIICNNGAKLIKDLKQGVPDATLIAPDGFSDPKSNGATFDGSYVSVAGQPPTGLKGEGKKFVDDFGAQIGTTPNPYSQYGAQAMDVMLDAIEKSDGTRGSVAAALNGLKVTDGIIGTFTLNAKGDTSLAPITIYQQKAGKLNPLKTVIPSKSLTGAT
jgi:branched-chain amino acid transport system substrate-binding protein